MSNNLVLASDTNFSLVRAGTLITVVCRGVFTSKAAATCMQATEKLAEEHPAAGSVLVVVEPNGPLPAPDARSRTAETMTRVAKSITGWAVVIEGTGLRTTMVRSALVAINLMSRSALPTKYFETAHDAARWLSGQPGSKIDSAEVERVVAFARTQIHPA